MRSPRDILYNALAQLKDEMSNRGAFSDTFEEGCAMLVLYHALDYVKAMQLLDGIKAMNNRASKVLQYD